MPSLKTIHACCRNETDNICTKLAPETKASLDVFDPRTV